MEKKKIEIEILIPNNKEYVDHIVHKDLDIYKVIPYFRDICQPKEGDFVKWTDNNTQWYGIFNHIDKFNRYYFFVFSRGLTTNIFYASNIWDSVSNLSLMNTKEITEFLLNLKKDKKDWDAEKKEVIDLGWKPKAGESYYYPKFSYEENKFVVDNRFYYNWDIDKSMVKHRVAKQTAKEAQKICDERNEAI